MNRRPTFPFELMPPVVRELLNKYKDATDTPPEFLAMAFLSTAASLAGPWYTLQGKMLNEYVILVGPSGVSRKSKAQRIAADLRQRVLAATTVPWRKPESTAMPGDVPLRQPVDAYTYATGGSIEGYESKRLGTGVSLSLGLDEFRRLLDTRRNKNMGDAAVYLTHWYDGDASEYVTVGREARRFSCFSVNILGGSTQSWLEAMKSDELREGGFINRCLIAPAYRTTQVSSPKEITDLSDCIPWFEQIIPRDLHLDISENAHAWQATITELRYADDAQYLWESYFLQRDSLILGLQGTSWLCDIMARELTHAEKLAGISALLRGTRVVSVTDLRFGVTLARWCMRELAEFCKPAAQAFAPWNSHQAKKIVAKLSMEHPVSKRSLQQAFGSSMPATELNRHLDIMHICGWIECNEHGIRLAPSYHSNIQQDPIQDVLGSIEESEIRPNKSQDVGSQVQS